MNERQQRFLEAYSVEPTITGACRRCAVHRATIYRWRADPAFVQAMDAAWKAWNARYIREVIEPAARARAAWRAEREAARLPERSANLARALEARRRKRGY